MDIVVDHTWVPVERAPGIRYLFPSEITSYLRARWRGPAVYRWVVFHREPGDLRRLYVGEAKLLPQRVTGYLKPGPPQPTNQRLHHLFAEERTKGRQIQLEVLEFQQFWIEGIRVSMRDLADAKVRRFLENLFCIRYAREGYELLNA